MNNNQGFTLIETLIYLAIIGAVVASFVSYSLSITNSRSKAYVVQEVQANSRLALDLITQNIRMSNGLNLGSSTFNADPGMISLSMASTTLNPTVFRLDADDGVLQISQGGGNWLSVTSDEVSVANLLFATSSPSGEKESVNIFMTIEFYNPDNDQEFEYSRDLRTSVNIRN
jgi:prepilin-type N-terminal cleavage/methylation domain-containing protein